MENWITDREPTEEENLDTDIGFIVCITGDGPYKRRYHKAVVMGVFYEHGRWYDDDGWIDTERYNQQVLGWMMPPRWEGGSND